MLINYADDYVNYINAGYILLGDLEATIAQKEKFMGKSKYLDNLRAHSLLLSAILDHLSYNDNLDPQRNEKFLLCLKSLLNKKLC